MKQDQKTSGHSSDLRSFGRRRGRKLSARQEKLLGELLPKVCIHLDSLQFPPDKEVWLEIGFGGGEHLVWQAEQSPSVLILGCEPFEEGVVKLLSQIEEKRLSNIRIYPDDVRPLLRELPEASLNRVFILFPDPWPKKRHAKRRLVTPQLVELLARAVRKGGELRIATDIGDYARTSLLAVSAVPGFRWAAKSPADWRNRNSDWPATRYETKGLAACRRCYFLRFHRI